MEQRLKCILIVDDDDVNNLYTKIILEDMNCSLKVKTKTSVDEAFDYLARTNYMTIKETQHPFPDLIFLDIDMPVKNGWNFLESYKRMKDFLIKKPIIIMVSSSIDQHDHDKATSMPDVSNYYPKPLTTEIVDDVLLKYFPETHYNFIET